MSDESNRAEIIRLENERCRALVARDFPALKALLADDLVHVHANGKIDSQSDYLLTVEEAMNFLSVERRDLRVRTYGDTAIATGRLDQTIEFAKAPSGM